MEPQSTTRNAGTPHRSWTPMSCNQTSVATTHDVSKASPRVCVEARMLRTLTDGWSCWLMSGAMRVWFNSSSTLKQHDASDTGRKLPGIDASLCLNMETTTLCLNRDGTVRHVETRFNNFSRASCHDGKNTLRREEGRPSSPTTDSTHRDNARRSSELVKVSSKSPGIMERNGEASESPHDVCKGHEVLPPLLLRSLSWRPPHRVRLVLSTLPMAESVATWSCH